MNLIVFCLHQEGDKHTMNLVLWISKGVYKLLNISALLWSLTFWFLLQAQQRESFVQERYGRYDLSDPFMALQRDSEVMQEPSQQTQARGQSKKSQVNPGPLAVLKLVMAHCKHMQEKMMAQLAAAESRHRRVRGLCVG